MKLLHELVRDYAAAFPAKAAVSDARGEISYGIRNIAARRLFLLDAHALGSESLREMFRGMHATVGREYFETCPLFKELRIITTPHEHDLMMDEPSLDIIVPELYRALGIADSE